MEEEKIEEDIEDGSENEEKIEIENRWREREIGKELKRVRKVKKIWQKLGKDIGIDMGGMDMWKKKILGLQLLGEMKKGKKDEKEIEKDEK